MLILSRKVQQEILIGTDIRVMIVSVRGGRVKLGIQAPASIEVYRSEIAEQRPRSVSDSDALADAGASCPAAVHATPAKVAEMPMSGEAQ